MVERWLVIFCDPDPLDGRANWRDRLVYRGLKLLKPGFRHCYAMRRGKSFAGWLIADVQGNRTNITEVPDDLPIDVGGVTFASYTDYVDVAEASGLATILNVIQQPGGRCKLRWHFNCVTSVKHLLGIEGAWVMTPWQLYKYLKAEAT